MKTVTTYVLLPNVSGTLHTKAPSDYKRSDGGKFILDANLSQQDLQYLFEVKNETEIISKITQEVPQAPPKPSKGKKEGDSTPE